MYSKISKFEAIQEIIFNIINDENLKSSNTILDNNFCDNLFKIILLINNFNYCVLNKYSYVDITLFITENNNNL